MKVCVFTLGCKVNRYESDVIINKLIERGYEVTENLEKADYYVINTCAVTAEAEKKSRQCVARVKKQNPDAKILICGCASENNAKQKIFRKVTKNRALPKTSGQGHTSKFRMAATTFAVIV